MTNELPAALVVGGTSGLGLELALLLQKTHGHITITGQHDPGEEKLTYHFLGLDTRYSVRGGLDPLVLDLPPLTLLIWAAATEERNTLAEATDNTIDTQLNLGPRGAAMLLARLLRRQARLENFIVITSTSQTIPRPFEANYCAAKAGLATLAQCAAEQESVGRVLVAAPSGMNTSFWRQHPRHDAAELLDPKEVAGEILRLHAAMKEKFEAWLILRNPMHSIPFMEDPRKKAK